jgi:hypothetical protein
MRRTRIGHTIRRAFGLSACLLLLAGTAGGAAACGTTVIDSGIEGEVRIAPVNPVEQPGVENSAPYAAKLLVRKADGGDVVAETTSGADGSFRLPLAPGDYVLEPVNGDPLPTASPQPFTVEAGRFTTLRVDYDSGIR